MLYTEQNLAAALALARAGIPIFPALILKRNTGWMKKPAINDWQERASTDETQIRRWFVKFPQAVPGIELGRAGLLVLDPDRHGDWAPDGIEAFAQLAADIGGLPEHPQGGTPAGFHHFWKQPDGIVLGNGSGGLPKGIDVRGKGGWVVAPGSIRIDGQTYTPRAGTPSLAEAFKAGTIPALPDAIVRLITEGDRNGSHDDFGHPTTDFPLPVDVEAELADMRPGNVNRTHCKVIGSMLSAGLPYEDIVALVVNRTMQMAVMLNLKDWTQANEFKFVRSCMVGLLKARCQQEENLCPAPAWVAPELADDWEAIAQKGGRPHIVWRTGSGWYVRNNWTWDREKRGATTSENPQSGSSADADQPNQSNNNEQTTAEGSSSTKEQTTAGGSSSHNEQARQQSRQPPPRIVAKPFVAFDEASLPRREWMYAKHYQRGQVTVTIGPGGAGKSSLDMVEAIAMAAGRNLLGEQPTARYRVWVHNGDDDRLEMRRIAAICRHYGINMKELEGWLFVTGKDDMAIKIAVANGRLVPNRTTISEIMATIGANEIDVVVMEPLITLHEVAENDNVRMNAVIHLFGEIGSACDCSVELCHHTRKLIPGTEEATIDDSRGASASKDAFRGSRILNLISREDARKAGIEEQERGFYFRVDRAKSNYLPPGAAVWRKFENVELLNGDQVGVVTAWEFQTDRIAVSDEDCEWIQAKVAKEYYRETKRAEKWIGRMVAKRLNLNPHDTKHTWKIDRAVRDLENKGVIAYADLKLPEDNYKELSYAVPGPWKRAYST
jgi:RecA-family ATPase